MAISSGTMKISGTAKEILDFSELFTMFVLNDDSSDDGFFQFDSKSINQKLRNIEDLSSKTRVNVKFKASTFDSDISYDFYYMFDNMYDYIMYELEKQRLNVDEMIYYMDKFDRVVKSKDFKIRAKYYESDLQYQLSSYDATYTYGYNTDEDSYINTFTWFDFENMYHDAPIDPNDYVFERPEHIVYSKREHTGEEYDYNISAELVVEHDLNNEYPLYDLSDSEYGFPKIFQQLANSTSNNELMRDFRDSFNNILDKQGLNELTNDQFYNLFVGHAKEAGRIMGSVCYDHVVFTSFYDIPEYLDQSFCDEYVAEGIAKVSKKFKTGYIPEKEPAIKI